MSPEEAVADVTRSGDGRQTRWHAHRAERRHQIVEAALAVLAESGPDFGVEEVAERAGVTKPVVYRYFSDRAGLVDAMGVRMTEVLVDDWILPAVSAPAPPLERVRGCVSAFLGFVETHPEVYRLFSSHVPADGASAAHMSKELVGAAIFAAIAQYFRAGGAEDEPVELWAHGVIGFVQNAADRWLEHRAMSRERLIQHLTDLIWAQLDGIARRYGLVLDPTVPISPDDIVRRLREN